MSFTDEQKKQLEAPLNRSNVKEREQGGRQLSYIEGWHAIAEANRIFGFGAWSRETVDLKLVSEKEREIGVKKIPGWGVTYIARVRVRVGDVIRDGCGTGHGIDKDLGQAHESALKEAETDAMKRALMTFGNPFGLALYDKGQASVVDDIAEQKREFYVRACEISIDKAVDGAVLRQWWKDERTSRLDNGITQQDLDHLMGLLTTKLKALEPQKDAA